VSHSRPKTLIAGAAVVALGVFAATGCGSGNDNKAAGTQSVPSVKASPTAQATVGVGTTSLGKILVDAQGRSLYLFERDAGTKSTCSGACATNWPPLIAHGKPTAGRGAQASKLDTVKRDDGSLQVTYGGHPLYLFAGDQTRGQVNGQGSTAFGAPWFVLSASGTQIAN
jgi:predicted lipoprotein with Yx(FWY)xxD motif